MKTNIYSVYKTTNLVNNKIYYGVHRETKWPDVDDYLGSGEILKKAIYKHGKDNFKREILCISDKLEYVYYLESQIVTEEFINERTNYNMCGGGVGPTAYSDEVLKKLSEARKGEKNHFYGKTHSLETKKKISGSRKGKYFGFDNPFYGKTHSDEAKRKMSKIHKGKSLSNECKAKLSEAHKGEKNHFYGKTHSLETRKKISEARKRKKIAPWNKGKTGVYSEKAIERMRVARKKN